MRAVILGVDEALILERMRQDIDRWDEMWDGEYHMSPPPSWEHQGSCKGLTMFFAVHWEELGEGVFCHDVGIKPPGTEDVDIGGKKIPSNYKVPDLVFLRKGHERRIRGGWVVGAPDAVLEVRSPGDETYKKFPFFHSLGIPEVIVVQRDSKAVEVYARGKRGYRRVAANPDGSVTSKVLDTLFLTVKRPRGGPILRLRRGRYPNRVQDV